MKLIRQQQEQFVFEITGREKSLLLAVVRLFPLVPLTHHRLSKNAELPDAETNQHLLEESLKAQQAESQKWLMAMLDEPARFKSCKKGFHFTLNRSEIEGLLQVLNDVRIGSWIALGSPDMEQEEKLAVNEQTAPQVHRMELAGVFEMFFLRVVTSAG